MQLVEARGRVAGWSVHRDATWHALAERYNAAAASGCDFRRRARRDERHVSEQRRRGVDPEWTARNSWEQTGCCRIPAASRVRRFKRPDTRNPAARRGSMDRRTRQALGMGQGKETDQWRRLSHEPSSLAAVVTLIRHTTIRASTLRLEKGAPAPRSSIEPRDFGGVSAFRKATQASGTHRPCFFGSPRIAAAAGARRCSPHRAADELHADRFIRMDLAALSARYTNAAHGRHFHGRRGHDYQYGLEHDRSL